MKEDRFSKQAAAYSQFRPEYPKELFQFLLQHVPNTKLCWDCATGNGQAARALAHHFDQVIATDLSAAQISHATDDPKIVYRIVSAEDVHFESQSLDLVTVAQALHWFNLEIFYANVKRFLKPNGLIAAWGYDFFKISPEMDEILDPYGREFLKNYWSERNWLLIGGYKGIPFPFSQIETPDFYLKVEWDFFQLKGYLDSWSATQKYKDKNGFDPFDAIADKLELRRGEKHQKKSISWKLITLMGSNV